MPTGYTAPIYDNEEITAREFACLMARSLGFTIHQRDDDFNAPPRKRHPSTEHHENRIREATTELYWLRSATDDEVMRKQQQEIAERRATDERIKSKNKQLAARYDFAIDVITNWQPVTEAGRRVREQAMSQLEESKRFDCSTWNSRDYTVQSVDEYRRGRVNKLENDVARDKKYIKEELERCAEANRWIDEFYQDLDLLPDIRLDA